MKGTFGICSRVLLLRLFNVINRKVLFSTLWFGGESLDTTTSLKLFHFVSRSYKLLYGQVTCSIFLQRKSCFELITQYKPKVFVSQITRLEEKHIEDQRNIKRMVEEQMRTQKEQAEAAISEARERSTAEKERYLRQQRDLQAQIDAAKRKQQQDEQTIKNLRDRLRRM